MPVYFVIVEWMSNPQGIGIWKILKVFECDLTEVSQLWNKVYTELSGTGRNIQSHIYYREPANPFKEQALLQEN